jgi:hypothetical protein
LPEQVPIRGCNHYTAGKTKHGIQRFSIDAFKKEYQACTQSSQKPGKQCRNECLVNRTQSRKEIDQHNYRSGISRLT